MNDENPPFSNLQSQDIPVAHHYRLAAAAASFTLQSPTFNAAILTPNQNPTLSVSSIIIPERSLVIPKRRTAEGILVKSTSLVWNEIVQLLGNDWTGVYQLTPETLEELVAGAYKNAGYDDVTLTPRSGDHGRDVIAIKHGIGCVKIIDSVKRYAPGNLVDYNDIRALGFVVTADSNASKGIITTTSDFPPRVKEDPFVAPFLPTRLELMNGEALQKWLRELAVNNERRSRPSDPKRSSAGSRLLPLILLGFLASSERDPWRDPRPDYPISASASKARAVSRSATRSTRAPSIFAA